MNLRHSRTKGFAGFQLLGLNDFPGQGTALAGVLDAFWEEKGYITPEEFKQFSGQTVPLARLPKMVYPKMSIRIIPLSQVIISPIFLMDSIRLLFL